MSHYAKVREGIVEKVIVAEAAFFDTHPDFDSPGTWIQTSYNTIGGKHYVPSPDGNNHLTVPDNGVALRKNYAGVGYTYDKDRDAFYAPQPHDSWILNEDTCIWEAPVTYPDDGKHYTWNEGTTSWDEYPE